MRGNRAIVVALGLLLALASPASADPQDVANDIARNMISPYCPGVTLHDCPSDSSHELRRRIAGWAESGMDKAAIEERLEAEFGEDIWATPPKSGFGLGAWLLPAAAAGIGIGLIALLAVRWTRRGSDEGPSFGSEITGEQRRRLDAELAALRDRQG